jgi:2-dehydro-3-deoxygalactonokinase
LSQTAPAFVSIDWGTSSFRAYLSDMRGQVLAEVSTDAGALSLKPGEHEAYVAERIRPWLTDAPGLPVIASGMVGARQGWIETPYAVCPAGETEIALATVVASAPSLGRMCIAPGVRTEDARGAPDVMRGEETQILGALAAMGGEDGLFVLPGTHSKWARVEKGRIVGFRTYMTGEVFAVLKTHSVLGRMMIPPSSAVVESEGFTLGLDAARLLARPGDLLHAIFMARTFGLFERVPPRDLAEYLSGLLIGAEILAGADGAKAGTAIGAPSLTARYRAAASRLGVRLMIAPSHCTALGQLTLLRRLKILL